jgi:hypothetical protein
MPQKPKAAGKGAAQHLKPSYCLLESARQKFLESAQNAGKASGEGAAAKQLKPAYCLQKAGKVYGKGAAGHLKAG